MQIFSIKVLLKELIVNILLIIIKCTYFGGKEEKLSIYNIFEQHQFQTAVLHMFLTFESLPGDGS